MSWWSRLEEVALRAEMKKKPSWDEPPKDLTNWDIIGRVAVYCALLGLLYWLGCPIGGGGGHQGMMSMD